MVFFIEKKIIIKKLVRVFCSLCCCDSFVYVNFYKFVFYYVVKRKEWNLGIMNIYCF